jgi:hypothetical protein
MLSEFSRNNGSNRIPAFKAENLAANVLQYQNSISNYILVNYDALHLPVSENSGNVEQIQIIDYARDQIVKFNKKSLMPFLNYQTIVFNYSRVLAGESQPMPVLYMATTWNTFSTTQLANSYAGINMNEVIGKLGEDLSKRLYQGNSTYWTIPWLFSQNNCQITELYVQLPDSAGGNSKLSELKNVFNKFCTQIQTSSSYRFLTYVYLAPVFNSDL